MSVRYSFMAERHWHRCEQCNGVRWRTDLDDYDNCEICQEKEKEKEEDDEPE
jgi:hypothetical protein